ncbi:hypothetical protein BC940DRAFT_300306 [Gongronella butleri]|nr:hypothetical protein BC940DRAFT_300306 [Gongronella butleri]
MSSKRSNKKETSFNFTFQMPTGVNVPNSPLQLPGSAPSSPTFGPQQGGSSSVPSSPSFRRNLTDLLPPANTPSTMRRTFSDTANSTPSSPAATATASSVFTFQPTNPAMQQQPPASPAAPSFQFGPGHVNKPAASAAPAAAPSPSAFAFNAPKPASTTGSPAITFGSPAPSSPKTGGFTFGAAPSGSSAAPAAAAGAMTGLVSAFGKPSTTTPAISGFGAPAVPAAAQTPAASTSAFAGFSIKAPSSLAASPAPSFTSTTSTLNNQPPKSSPFSFNAAPTATSAASAQATTAATGTTPAFTFPGSTPATSTAATTATSAAAAPAIPAFTFKPAGATTNAPAASSTAVAPATSTAATTSTSSFSFKLPGAMTTSTSTSTPATSTAAAAPASSTATSKATPAFSFTPASSSSATTTATVPAIVAPPQPNIFSLDKVMQELQQQATAAPSQIGAAVLLPYITGLQQPQQIVSHTNFRIDNIYATTRYMELPEQARAELDMLQEHMQAEAQKCDYLLKHMLPKRTEATKQDQQAIHALRQKLDTLKTSLDMQLKQCEELFATQKEHDRFFADARSVLEASKGNSAGMTPWLFGYTEDGDYFARLAPRLHERLMLYKKTMQDIQMAINNATHIHQNSPQDIVAIMDNQHRILLHYSREVAILQERLLSLQQSL